jgi:hypothetical protein
LTNVLKKLLETKNFWEILLQIKLKTKKIGNVFCKKLLKQKNDKTENMKFFRKLVVVFRKNKCTIILKTFINKDETFGG